MVRARERTRDAHDGRAFVDAHPDDEAMTVLCFRGAGPSGPQVSVKVGGAHRKTRACGSPAGLGYLYAGGRPPTVAGRGGET